ncbi:MAG: hypothetical protein P1V97_02260 [Planctomycetota bacterium]|nr:hypothetical protein [Planctomycetota bacterium]
MRPSLRRAVVVFIAFGSMLSPDLLAAQCFQGEQQKRLERTIQRPTLLSHKETTQRLAKYKQDQNWLAAMTLCDEILVQDKYAGAMLGDGKGSWCSLRTYAREFLLALPSEGMEFYRLRRRAAAQRLWLDGSREALQLLLSRYPLPEYQARARTRLFNERVEEGAFHDAYRVAVGHAKLLKRLPAQLVFALPQKLVTLSKSVKASQSKQEESVAGLCHVGEHLACFPGRTISFVIRREQRDDPAFRGAEFGGLVLPKQRRYTLEALVQKEKKPLWTRPLCVLGGQSKELSAVFLASERWIYGVLEHELMLCIDRVTGELKWLRDLRPKGPPAIEIGGPELNRPDTKLSLGVKTVLRLSYTKKRAELIEAGSGARLATYLGQDDDHYFSALSGRLLRVDKGGQVWVDDQQLDASRDPQLNSAGIQSIAGLGEALVVRRADSSLLWFPGSGERFKIAGQKTEFIESVQRRTKTLRIRYRGKDYWEQYALAKKELKLSVPKGP